MGDNIIFDVLGNVWFYLKSKDTKLSQRNDINYQMGLFNDYQVSFHPGAIYPKIVKNVTSWKCESQTKDV